MPEALDLPDLVSDFRTAGLDVTLVMSGNVELLPPAAGLSVYRIVQESLTNVVKHAPGEHARVELNVTDTDIRLMVQNTTSNGAVPRGDGGGLGVRGMIERAAVLDGSLAAGPYGEGWTVFMHAPLPAPEGR
jgi:signal transduction histidine kinase